MKKVVVGLTLFIACFSLPKTASANWWDWWMSGGGSNNGGNNSGNTVPLDGGLSLLAIAGIGYGVKRFAKPEKKQDD